jgi:glucokinase
MEGRLARDLEPSDVTDAAIAGSDAQCVQAVHYFTRFLGHVAGNLALTLGSLGGVYIGGGVVPRLGSAFDSAVFRQCFENKGRYRQWLSTLPVWVITASTPALIGASRALDALP